MHLSPFHPLGAVTATLVVACVWANFVPLEWRSAPFSYAISSLLLASPFLIFLAGHLTVARTWRRNAYLAVGSVLFVVPWLFISFAMRWFHGGWAGVAVGTAIMMPLALGYLASARRIPEEN